MCLVRMQQKGLPLLLVWVWLIVCHAMPKHYVYDVFFSNRSECRLVYCWRRQSWCLWKAVWNSNIIGALDHVIRMDAVVFYSTLTWLPVVFHSNLKTEIAGWWILYKSLQSVRFFDKLMHTMSGFWLKYTVNTAML